MEEQGATRMIREKELTGEVLLSHIEDMIKDQKRYADAAEKIGQPKAANHLYKEVKKLIRGER